METMDGNHYTKKLIENKLNKIEMRMKKLSLVFFMCIVFQVGKAQIGTIDSSKLYEVFPDIQKTDSLIMAEQQRYQNEFNQKETELQNAVKDYKDKYENKPEDSASLAALSNLQTLNNSLSAYQQEANKKIIDYQNLLMKPYLDKINSAIKTVAERRKFSQIIDRTQTPLLYHKDTNDITSEVLNELKK
mgnify:CR=1 FL=1